MKFFIFFLPICLFFSLNAQTVSVSGIINNYASVNSIGSQSVNVSSTSGFNIGDRVLLIQMKGATIDTTNTLNFGTITSYNDAGNYEMLSIANISSTAILFTTPLLRTYNASGIVQLVKVPVYNNLNVIGLLTCSPWNGSMGGVLAFEASGNVTLNANIDITGKGFLGGGNVLGQFFSCLGNTTDYKLPTLSLASAFKGEGITNTYSTYSKGLGALANGGGAGNDVNGGGAGGGNFGMGGHGGNTKCSTPPIALCGGSNGKSCNYSNTSNKIFLGGGGGAGHQNDGVGTGGVSGGGIILIRCVNLIGNNNFIVSDGTDNTAIAGNDGQGGGGAGGTILIDACSSSSLTISAKGGFGGIDNYVGASCHGKGGGGGGGIIWTSSPLIYSSVLTGGLPGIFTSGTSPCFNTSNGATTGQVGGTLSGLIIPGVTSSSGTYSLGISTICVNNNNSTAIATITTNISSPIISYTWTNSGSAIISQTNNSTSLTNTVTNLTNGIYTLLAQINAPCGPIISQTININCPPPPPLCSGTLGAPVFLEDFGSGSALYGPALPLGVTNYIYQTGPPPNGTYVISSSSNPSGINLGYVNDGDHTGNMNGYMMVVNSDYPASEVYRKHVTGLCQNTTYVFSSYLSNNNTPSTPTTVCPGYVYANVKFQIEYPLSTIQNSITTGNLPLGLSNTALNWNQFGFTFTTLPGQTSVDVVLINNAPGGCGNDYVVDDISLSPCGPGVSLSISPNNSVFCPGSSLTLQSSFTSGGYTLPQYQWQFSSNSGITWTNIVGATSQNYSISSVTSTQTGSYQLLVAENGNINSASCRIEAGPLTFSVSNGISLIPSTTICNGANSTLTATGATNYTWSTGANTNSIIVNPSTTTSYTVIGTIGTCSNSAVSTVSIIPSPTITITPTLSLICSGQTTSLTASGANAYTWTPSSTLSSNTGSMVASTPITTTMYTVTGTANTCTNSAITTVSVLPSPTITLSPNTSICQGSGTSATLTANGATSYTWNSAANLSSATGSIVTANPNSTETYTVTGTLNSCTSTAVTTVSIITTPTLSVNSSSAIICPLGSASLTATGATNYTWSPISTLSSSSGSLVIASPNNATTYTVLGSNGTCTNIAQTQAVITVTNNPIITSSNATICSSVPANLSANGGVTYTWSPATNLNTTTGPTVISTPIASIIYTVSGSSALGCIGSSSVSVTVIPTPTLTISSNSLNLCIVGQSSTLTANGASSYTWSPTTTINNINTNTTIATPVVTTIYSVIGSNGFSPNICTSTQTIQINVGASSIPTVSPNDEICFGQLTTIYAIGGNTYHWSPTTGVYKPNDSTTLVKPSVTTIYTVTVSKNNICPVTATIQVIVNPLPIVNAGKDSTINIDQDIVLTGTGNVDVGFLSPDGNPLICNWCPIVTVHPLENTCYTLEGFNTYGCRNTDVVCITITKEWDIFIPNAFTPNGDTSNDYFIPKGYGIAQIDLSIFDRWGVCIFKETNTTLGWDGKYKGQLCQQGIYVYQVNIKAMSGENTTKTGHVTLLSKLK